MQHVKQTQEMELENPIAHIFYLKRGKKKESSQAELCSTTNKYSQLLN